MQKAEAKASDPKLWEDSNRAQKYLKKQGALREQLRPLQQLFTLIEETGVFLELAGEEETEEPEAIAEAGPLLEEIKKRLDQMELETLFSGSYDFGDAIVSLH
ncbi:MAG: PCRF domain-containing protein, partial [Bacillota bacterium]